MDITTPFATLLIFYDNHKRSKLNKIDLLKIIKKYHKNPCQLTTDIIKKFGQAMIPKIVSLSQLCRLFSIYEVPDQYRKLCLPESMHHVLESSSSLTYNSAADVSSPQFDAMKALASRCVHSSLYDNSSKSVPPRDNLTKFKYLLTSPIEPKAITEEVDRINKGKTNSSQSLDGTKLPASVNPIEQIARTTIENSKKRKIVAAPPATADTSTASEGSIVYSTLYLLMHEKALAQVVIRGRNRYRINPNKLYACCNCNIIVRNLYFMSVLLH